MKKSDMDKIKKELSKIFDELSDFSDIPDDLSDLNGVMDYGHVCALYFKNKDFKRWFCCNFSVDSPIKNTTASWLENSEPKKFHETKIKTSYITPILKIAEILGEHVNIKVCDDAPIIIEIENYFEYIIAPKRRDNK